MDANSANSGPESLRERAERALRVERELSGHDDLPPENVRLITWSVAEALAVLDALAMAHAELTSISLYSNDRYPAYQDEYWVRWEDIKKNVLPILERSPELRPLHG